MPTRGRRGRSSKSSGEGDYSMGSKIKAGAKKGIEGYLKGTQKLADKITTAFPRSGSTSGRRGAGGRRGGRGRSGGGSRS